MNNAPIGVYDSGIGGLSVWDEIHRHLPDESLIYLGDGKNCPYGGRSREDITRFAEEAVEELLRHGVKMVVVGCNTATTGLSSIFAHAGRRCLSLAWSLP